jgi:hypothetical protein
MPRCWVVLVWNDVLDTELKELRQVGLDLVGLVDLVDDQEDRLAALEGHLGDAAVFFGDGNVGLDDDPDDIGAVGGLGDLLLDGEFKVVLGSLIPAVSTSQKCFGGPRRRPGCILGLGHDAVAGRAGLAGHDGLFAFEDSIEQAGLTNVSPPDDCDDRQFLTHIDSIITEVAIDIIKSKFYNHTDFQSWKLPFGSY